MLPAHFLEKVSLLPCKCHMLPFAQGKKYTKHCSFQQDLLHAQAKANVFMC